MPLNTTGNSNPQHYVLGRGRLYFALLDANGKPGRYRFLGNCPEFSSTVNIETLRHQSSQQGLRSTDKEVETLKEIEVSFSLDEINAQNLALFFGGDVAAPTNAAIAGFAEYQMVADGDLEVGGWYDIQDNSGVRAYDIDPTDLVVKTTNLTPVTLVSGTDYIVDQTLGRFQLQDTAAVATAITNGEGLDVTLTAEATASTLTQVQALKKSSELGALKFISENPANNDAIAEYQFHQISLKANGELGLISEEWAQMGFQGVAEKNPNAAYASSPTLSVTDLAA